MSQTSVARRRAFDAAIAILLATLNLLILFPLAASNVAVIAALVVVHAGCLFWRRDAPVVVLGVTAVTGFLVLVLGYPSVVLGLAAVVALYTVATITPRGTSVPTAAVMIVLTAAAQLVAEEASVDTVLGNAFVLGVAWFLGDSIGQRRDYVRRLEERTAELEQARDELARTAVVEERLRIARDLHDILGHSVGVIAVQAGVGAHVIDDDPAEAKRSLEAIESVSRSALGEIRQVLTALREEAEHGEVHPQPGIADLSELVADLSAGDIEIRLDVDDEVRSMSPGLQLTIYRVVQEALTNVIRHSGARLARVSVRIRSGEVHVEIVDDGSGSSGPAGNGLLGMSERVAMQGGSFDAGSLKDKGFRVSARLPIAGAS